VVGKSFGAQNPWKISGSLLLESKNLRITRLEDSQDLQEAVLSVFHSFMIMFGQTSVTKIIENHQGKMFLDMVPPPAPQVQTFTIPFPPGMQFPPAFPPAAIPPGGVVE